MPDILGFIEAVDDPFALLVVVLLAIGALAWRFLDAKLKWLAVQADATKETVNRAADAADRIDTAIITNHGSKSLGDAIDRLTEHSFFLMRMAAVADENQRVTMKTLESHITESAPLAEWVHSRMAAEQTEG